MPSGMFDNMLSDMGAFVDCASCNQMLHNRPESDLIDARRGYQEEQLEEKLIAELVSMYEV